MFDINQGGPEALRHWKMYSNDSLKTLIHSWTRPVTDSLNHLLKHLIQDNYSFRKKVAIRSRSVDSLLTLFELPLLEEQK